MLRLDHVPGCFCVYVDIAVGRIALPWKRCTRKKSGSFETAFICFGSEHPQSLSIAMNPARPLCCTIHSRLVPLFPAGASFRRGVVQCALQLTWNQGKGLSIRLGRDVRCPFSFSLPVFAAVVLDSQMYLQALRAQVSLVPYSSSCSSSLYHTLISLRGFLFGWPAPTG